MGPTGRLHLQSVTLLHCVNGPDRMSSSFLHIFLTVYAALFPIVNPLGGAPIFLSFVRGSSPKIQEQMARKIAIYGFTILMCAMLFGAQILMFFGVSIPVLNVAGGLVVASLGWNLLHQGGDPDKKEDAKELREEDIMGSAFYPLTMPLTVGPGSIATAIALSAGHTIQPGASWANLAISFGGAACGLLAMSLTIYFAFREANTIERVLGKTGTNVLVRLFAFILLAIGLQMLWGGIHELIDQVAKQHLG